MFRNLSGDRHLDGDLHRLRLLRPGRVHLRQLHVAHPRPAGRPAAEARHGEMQERVLVQRAEEPRQARAGGSLSIPGYNSYKMGQYEEDIKILSQITGSKALLSIFGLD